MNSVPFLHQLLELLAKSALILLAAAALAAALSRGPRRNGTPFGWPSSPRCSCSR